MSEEVPTPQEGEGQEAKTFDAEYVDKLRKEAAKYRTEAKANAEAAKRLAEIEESQKTAQQKADERIASLEQEIARANLTALRSRVQAKHGISDEDADLFLTGTDEDTLTAQAKRLADREAERKQKNNVSPREGTNPAPATDDKAAFARTLFAGDGDGS